MGSSLKKIFAVLLAMLLLASAMPLPSAQASGIPVVDLVHITETTSGVVQNTITAAEQTIDTVQNLYEWAQTFVLQALKTQLVGKLQDKVLGYIQGGNAGPQFVTSWLGLAADARVDGAQSFSKALSASDVCPSFRKDLLETVGASGNSGGADGLSDFKCGVTGEQIAAFNDDFNNGGWEMYRKMQEPQNNYLASLLEARKRQQSAVVEAEKAAQNEALAGGGFKSAKKADGTITTPGRVIADALSNANKADFDLITNANSIQDLASAAVNSLTSNLTKGSDSKGDDNGLSGVSLRERVKRRNSIGKTGDKAPTKNEVIDQCNELFPTIYLADGVTIDIDLDESMLREICIESGGAETGSGNSVKARLLRDIAGMLSSREAAKLAFDNTIPALIKRKNAFDKDKNGEVDPDRLCSATEPGRKRRTGEIKFGQPNSTVPSSLETGEIYSFKDGKGKTVSCILQSPDEAYPDLSNFEDMRDSINELRGTATYEGLDQLNNRAINALRKFRSEVKTTSIKNEDALASLALEFYQAEPVPPATLADARAKICGNQILLYPSYNEECADYTLARAKRQVGRQEPDELETQLCSSTDTSAPDYDPECQQ